MAIIAKWKYDKMFGDADASACATEIASLGEGATTSGVLEYARSHANSELHKCFDWDDSTAAEKFRLFQARQVCSSLYVVKEKVDEEHTIPKRVFMKTDNSAETPYRPVQLIIKHEDQYEKLLKQAWIELQAFKKKYESLVELRDIFALIP